MNETLVQTLLIFVVAFFGYMHSYWGSTMHNRPIVVSTLVGLVLGDIKTGITIGATLELAFLGAVPIGASNPPDMVSGAAIATAFVILSGQEIGTAVTLAITIATLVALIDNVLMMFVLTEAGHIADKYAAQGDCNKLDMVVRVASIGNKVVLALVVALGYYYGIPVIEQVLTVIPEFIIHGMDVVAGLLPAVGVAMLAKMILTKELSPYLLFGFLITAYLGVPTFGVALVGLGAAVLAFFKKSDVQKEVVVDDNEF